MEQVPRVKDVECADFRVRDATHRYVIEVKTREDNADYWGKATETGTAFQTASPGYQNRLSGIVRKAASQLSATPGDASDFRLIWFSALGRDWKLIHDQLKATVYGEVDLVDTAKSPLQSLPCYFFDNAEFVRQVDVDGIILSASDRGLLCINPASPRGEPFKRSGLFRFFVDQNAVVDPVEREREGRAYLADIACPRKNDREVLRYVQQKYGRPMLTEIRGIHARAVMFVPDVRVKASGRLD